ncbi:hypothetical protein [Saccharibacillus sacchari]|uniref:hypothetical protein n=1 Tax=Saccharibacillus sacchari TaxID=456493 RepID=UPI0004BB760A|nr:hypothetical protein [Saccharibacillus sacchari]
MEENLNMMIRRPNSEDQASAYRMFTAMVNEMRNRGVETFCLDSGYGKVQERWGRRL